jgi:putative SOS response-associated peptidase YedK
MSFRWGLIPWWSKDAKAGSRLFNARGETVATRASFREAFRERRIIVPADGFYEWHKTKTGTRQPHYFSRADGQPLAFAGLAERWRDKNAGPDAPLIRSCTVITTSAGPDMSGIHDRMPVILDPATFDLWLDPANEDVEEMRALLRAPPAGTLVHHPVGTRVGNVRNNDAALLEAV